MPANPREERAGASKDPWRAADEPSSNAGSLSRSNVSLLARLLGESLGISEMGPGLDLELWARLQAIAQRHAGHLVTSEAVLEELLETVLVSQGGDSFRLSGRNSFVIHQVADLLRGDPQAMDRLAALWFRLANPQPPVP